MSDREPLIPRHGGYRRLRSFQVAKLVYDVTVRFFDFYIDRRSRTHDQMVQAARSGAQNIAEGSLASATSKKTELKLTLTQVARASLEELKLDFEDFLRQRRLPLLAPNHSVLLRFKERKPLRMCRRGCCMGGRRGSAYGKARTHGRARTHGLAWMCRRNVPLVRVRQ